MRKINIFFQAVSLILLVSTTVYAETYTVTSREDSGVNTLRWAVQQANAMPGADLIIFPVVNSITVYSPIQITDRVELYGAGTQVVGGNKTEDVFEFMSGSDGSTLSAIAINEADVAIGIWSDHNRIKGCRIGSSWSGSGGSEIGLYIEGSFNEIGGTADFEGNTLDASFTYHIKVEDGIQNNFQANYIRGGYFNIDNAAGYCLVGGERTTGGNVFAGTEININGIGGNTICGNYIGVYQDQSSHMATTGLAITSPSNVIGLSLNNFGNIICAINTCMNIQSSNNVIQNNLIGLNLNDIACNAANAIEITSGGNNLIGGARNALRFESNVIAGAKITCIVVGGSGGNTISGNIIGLDSDGDTAMGANDGIDLVTSNNLIGGSNANLSDQRGNIVSGHNLRGIQVAGHNNMIFGNYIGTDLSGTTTIENNQMNIWIAGSTNTQIGGLDPGLRNIICGSDYGIRSYGNSTYVYNNWIGYYADLSLDSDPPITGISLEWGINNQIGMQNQPASGNLIRAAANGVYIAGAGTDYNAICGNTICAFGSNGILLAGDGANNNKIAPVIITPSDVALIQGTTTGPDDYIEVFVSNRGAGVYGGSVRFVGSTTAVSGNWSLVPTGLTGGEYVCAIATDSSNNSSGFSLNQLVQVPTPTYTPTPGNTPTSTPTPTATPVFQAFVYSISPEYSHAKAQVSCTVRGESFFTPVSVRLQGNGIAARYAANVVLLNSKVITCTFDLSGLAGGTYAVRVDSFGVYGVLNNGLKIINPIALPINWEVLDMGQAGTHAMANDTRGIYVGDGDNDALQEVFSAGLLQNILKYDLDTTWSISALPAGTIGESYTGVITCDMDNDGLREVYGTTLDHYVYQFSGANLAAKTNISGDLGYEQYALVCGDGNNDHALEIYTAAGDGNEGIIYQFSYVGSWSNTPIGSCTEKIVAIAVGDGDNDGSNEVYGACEDHNLYQFKYNGTSWAKSIVHTGENDAKAVVIGDGNQDGQNEVYTANLDGNIYQLKWTSGFYWNPLTITAANSYAITVSDIDNNATDELYCAGTDGHVYQMQYSGGAWNSTDLGTIPGTIYSLAAGDGDNDYQLELYALAGDHHVYQIKASHANPTATPTVTPIKNFDGNIISKKHIYAAPNPARGSHANIVIYTNQAADVSGILFTTSNQEVLSFRRHYSAGKNVERINISNLANGVYLLLVKAKAGGVEERVIKKIAIVK
ncbi:T9SS type A sorting domain-containing protein [bacterium]|nr:T9SS type A sorting domain-containing protein [bacterium]